MSGIFLPLFYWINVALHATALPIMAKWRNCCEILVIPLYTAIGGADQLSHKTKTRAGDLARARFRRCIVERRLTRHPRDRLAVYAHNKLHSQSKILDEFGGECELHNMK
jgi:hypothetical protein